MKRTVGIIVVFIVAALFYASIWTAESNNTSTCLALTGMILSLQAGAIVLVIENT